MVAVDVSERCRVRGDWLRAVSGSRVSMGSFTLRVVTGPDNDDFSGRTRMATNVTAYGSLFGATVEAGEPVIEAGVVSMWLEWTPNTTDVHSVLSWSVGTALTMSVAVFTNTSGGVTSLTLVSVWDCCAREPVFVSMGVIACVYACAHGE